MCGLLVTLNGIERAGAPDPCECLHHRGPDGEGHAVLRGADWEARLHFRRLAILDLHDRSNQPLGDPTRGLLVFNGEIYNHDHLRERLRGRGVDFATTGDAEVLHELLLQNDWVALLDDVDGMFAFVLVLPDGEVRYGRDRFGVKPLYLTTHDGRVTALASEIAPLRQLDLVGDVDPVALGQGMLFLWTVPPLTGWQRCRVVEPGEVWSMRSPYRSRSRRWKSPAPAAAPPTDFVPHVRAAVESQVRADVPVGLLLSGGLDSSWLALEMSGRGFSGPVMVARTAPAVDRAAEPFEEDAPFAQRVASGLGLRPTIVDLDVDIVRGAARMPDLLEHPFGDPAALVLDRLCSAAAEHATVMLSGVGVEELFLGYERYQAVAGLQAVPTALRRAAVNAGGARILSARLRERGAKLMRMAAVPPGDWTWASQSYYTAAEWSALAPDIPFEHVVARHREVGRSVLDRGGTPLDALVAADRRLFLPGLNLHYADRASMSSSVELRVPFLAEGPAALALASPAKSLFRIGDGKGTFRQAAASAGVPSYVLKRSKTGFGAPVRSLMRDHGPAVWSGISRSSIFDDLLDRPTAGQVFADHSTGRAERGLTAYGMLCAVSWWERYVVGEGSPILDFVSSYELPGVTP